MSSHGFSERNVTPLEVGLAGAIVAYLLSAVVMRDLVSAEAAATLLRFPAVAIAAVSVIAVYTAVWFYLAPRARETAAREHEDLETTIGETIAAENRIREALAAASRWWHHLLGVTGGFIFGVFLAWGLTWLFA